MAGGKPDAEAKKAARREKRAASKARRQQIWQAFQMQRKEDKALIPWMLGAFLLGLTAAAIAWYARREPY